MVKYILISLLISLQAFSQKQNAKKPEFKPWEHYKSVNVEFETKNKRLDYMESNMATYCKDGPLYYSGFKYIDYKKDLALVDTSSAYVGLIITVKMSDNTLFVFLFHYLCDFNGKETGYVNVTYSSFKYGELNRSETKTFNIKRKRLYPKNNIYTEKLTCGKVSFITENNNKIKMIFSGKEIQLEPQVYQ